MNKVDIDPETGAEVWQLTDGPAAVDNIGCAQPCSDSSGGRIAIRGGIEGIGDATESVFVSILDLADGTVHPLAEAISLFPGMPFGGNHLYMVRRIRDRRMLCRVDLRTLAEEKLYAVPEGYTFRSLLSVSPDGRFCASTVRRGAWAGEVVLMDTQEQSMRVLYADEARRLSDAQFSPDARDLISFTAAEEKFGRAGVRIGVVSPHREEAPEWLPLGSPRTRRCTGHSAWVPQLGRVMASCRFDERCWGNLFLAGPGERKPTLVGRGHTFFAHVSVSRCGRFWVADGYAEPNTPIYIGSIATGVYRRLVNSDTSYRGPQETHTHPYLTADNAWLIFNSDHSGRTQVYGAKVPEDFLKGIQGMDGKLA